MGLVAHQPILSSHATERTTARTSDGKHRRAETTLTNTFWALPSSKVDPASTVTTYHIDESCGIAHVEIQNTSRAPSRFDSGVRDKVWLGVRG